MYFVVWDVICGVCCFLFGVCFVRCVCCILGVEFVFVVWDVMYCTVCDVLCGVGCVECVMWDGMCGDWDLVLYVIWGVTCCVL